MGAAKHAGRRHPGSERDFQLNAGRLCGKKDRPLDVCAMFVAFHLQIIVSLKAHPNLGARAEITGKTEAHTRPTQHVRVDSFA